MKILLKKLTKNPHFTLRWGFFVFFLTKATSLDMMGVSFISFIFLMNKLQTLGYSLVGLAATTSAAFAGVFGEEKVSIQATSQNTADQTVQTLIDRGMLFLSIIAVLYGIWGGFQIVTAGGDEEKVKKGRTILIQVVIGIIVIWLAGSIVKWLVGLVVGA